MRLIGERVVLRPATRDDADVIAAGFAEDPTMGQMLGMEPEEETAAFLRDSFPEPGAPQAGPASHWFAMTDPDTGEVVGEIGLVGVRTGPRRASLSVLTLPAHRRSGLALEAMELVIAWAQGELGLNRIELHTLPENAPMQRLAEAAGFTREGVLRDYAFERGRFVDNVVYSRLSSEASARRSPS